MFCRPLSLVLRPFGDDGGPRRRALRAAGRHHQSQRVRAGQFDRGGAVGRRRRARHADRAGDRRLHRQLRQDLPDRCATRDLAVRAGCTVHRGHPVPAQGRDGALGTAPAAQGEDGMTGQRSTSALLYLSGVTVSFDGFKALNNLSLLVEPGEMRAIIGPEHDHGRPSATAGHRAHSRALSRRGSRGGGRAGAADRPDVQQRRRGCWSGLGRVGRLAEVGHRGCERGHGHGDVVGSMLLFEVGR